MISLHDTAFSIGQFADTYSNLSSVTPSPNQTRIIALHLQWIPFAYSLRFKLYPIPLPYPFLAHHIPVTAACHEANPDVSHDVFVLFCF